jgi:hypothetical protein
MAAISRSLQRRPSIAKPLVAFHRSSPGRIAIPPRASRPLKASSTAQDDLARFSLRLSRELCRLDSRLTTRHLARCRVLGEIVTRMRRRRQFARTPQAIVQQTRKWFSFSIILMDCGGLLAVSNVPRPCWPFSHAPWSIITLHPFLLHFNRSLRCPVLSSSQEFLHWAGLHNKEPNLGLPFILFPPFPPLVTSPHHSRSIHLPFGRGQDNSCPGGFSYLLPLRLNSGDTTCHVFLAFFKSFERLYNPFLFPPSSSSPTIFNFPTFPHNFLLPQRLQPRASRSAKGVEHHTRPIVSGFPPHSNISLRRVGASRRFSGTVTDQTPLSSLNRYSMPVTRSRTYLADIGLEDSNNTTGFLFGDEDSNSADIRTTPTAQPGNTDAFPSLFRQQAYPTMVSLASLSV